MTAVPTLSDPSGALAVPASGDVIAGKYRVDSVVGTGGMGAVLSAKHMQLGQSVAIKVLQADERQREEASARFLREGQAAAALQSDHVVRIYDLGTLDDGRAFMVMELLRGRDLAIHLGQRGPLPIEEACEYLLQACEAIAEAHSLGIVHRDLKPSNLFLTQRSDGQPLIKVLDFGISKSITQANDPAKANLTSTRSVMGSPAYMSPEQVRDAKKVDHRTDIWSLGVILHELLAGKQAFEADTLPAMCAAIAADPPQPLRAARPDVPPELEALVVHCLEKDPSRRFPSVVKLAAALAPFAPLHRTQAIVIPPVHGTPPLRAGVELTSPTLRGSETPATEPAPSSGPQQSEPASARASYTLERDSTLISQQGPPSGRAVPVKRPLPRRTTAVLGVGVVVAAVVAAWGVWPRKGSTPTVSLTPLSVRSSFTLLIESAPSGAQVYEADQKLGATPILLTIERASVRDRPRLLVLRSPGYEPYPVVQEDSVANVKLLAKLLPEARGSALPIGSDAGRFPAPPRVHETRARQDTRAPEPQRSTPSAPSALPAPMDIRTER
jgi:serine/threonine protein kinase